MKSIIIKQLFWMFYSLVLVISCTPKENNYESNEEQRYKVNLSVFPHLSGTVTGSSMLKKGEKVTIEAVPKKGFEFDYWRFVGNEEVYTRENPHTFKIEGHSSLVAVFKNINEGFLINVSEQNHIETIVDYGVNVPKDKLFMVTRYIGGDFVENGISIDNSGIINDKGKISMVLNTKELQARAMYVPITGGGPHMWVYKQYSSGIFPWSKAGDFLSLSVKASVPYVQLTDSKGNVSDHNFTSQQAPVTQLSFGLYFKDITKGLTFAITAPMYESRGTFQETANQHDTATPFAISPLDSKSKYITKATNSSSIQSRPFVEPKHFEVHITKQNLDKIVRDTRADLSPDITKYELLMTGVMFELPNYVHNGHNVSMATLSELIVKIDREN